jgi:conjugative transfer signal peptidase TraF
MMRRRVVAKAAGVGVAAVANLAALAALAALAVGAAAVEPLVRWNGSGSLPRGVYLEIPRRWLGREPARGDLVLACAPAAAGELGRRRGYLGRGSCGAGALGGAEPLGKLVLAVAGDEVAAGAAGLELNGRAVEGSRPLARDAAGRALTHYPFGRFRVAAGEVWLFAPYHPRSFDSRYFGPVQESAILGWLVPVVIENDDRLPAFRLHRFHLSLLTAEAGR